MRKIIFVFVCFSFVASSLFADFLEMDLPEKSPLFSRKVGKSISPNGSAFWKIRSGRKAHFYTEDENGMPITDFFSEKELEALELKGYSSNLREHPLPLVGFSCDFGDSVRFVPSNDGDVGIICKTKFGDIPFVYQFSSKRFCDASDGMVYVAPPQSEVEENLFRIRLLKKHKLSGTLEKENLPIGFAPIVVTRDMTARELGILLDKKCNTIRENVWAALNGKDVKSLPPSRKWELLEECFNKTPIQMDISLRVRLASAEKFDIPMKSCDPKVINFVRDTFRGFLSHWLLWAIDSDESGNIYLVAPPHSTYLNELKGKESPLYRFYYDAKEKQWFHVSAGLKEVFCRPDPKDLPETCLPAEWFKAADKRIKESLAKAPKC